MPQSGKFHLYLFKKNKYLFSKFGKYISVEYREGKKILILNMGFAPEVDIDELISLKDVWEDFGFSDPEVSTDPFLISGTISYSVN